MPGPALPATRPAGTRPHLVPSLGALLTAAALLMGVKAFVKTRLPRRLPSYAAYAMSFKVNGNALQRLAFRTPDELPIYGSSELDQWVDYRADAVFRDRPTGFAVFPVGRGGATCLLNLQKLAAVGDAARGRRVVVFLSPTWFLQPGVDDPALAANLPVAQLSAWVFGHALSPPVKRQIARRLRDFPDYLSDEPLTASAVACLARPTPLNRLRLAFLTPLGRLQNALLDSFDYGVLLWEIVFPQRRFQGDSERRLAPAQPLPRTAAGGIDWDALAARAEAQERARRGDRPAAYPPRPDVPADPNRDFLGRLAASREFDDLALLVLVLKDLRLDAAIFSQPIDGPFRDAEGVSAETRRAYYQRLGQTLAGTGIAFEDFSEHENDPLFFGEIEHPSPKAWAFYDREIDRFYHADAMSTPPANGDSRR